MTNPFLTLEDINGALYRNQGFYWYEINTANISDSKDFSNIKYDFCKITKTTTSGTNPKSTYTIEIDNPYWTKGYYLLKSNGELDLFSIVSLNSNTLTIVSQYSSIRLVLYMGISSYDNLSVFGYKIKDDSINLNYEELNTTQTIDLINLRTGGYTDTTADLTTGFNAITKGIHACGFLLVNLIKSDFQFTCNQELLVGKVNKVALGTDSKYKPNGAMVGTNNPNITVLYNGETLPVTYDNTLEDYVFNLDLTNKTNEGNIKFKVIIEDNNVINHTETNIKLTASFEEINTLSKLTSLFSNGGIGRLTTNLTLTNDLNVNNNVYLTTVDKTLTMEGHKITVPDSKTFKAENITFTGGQNTIQQNVGSKVELTTCTFTDCTGLGSVIDCQVDIQSLNDPTDFNTTLTNCVISNCNNPAIISGGELTVTGADVTGKVDNPNYPYFLYQTDGEAVILDSKFKLVSASQITSDIEYNSAIFTCGETAQINGHTHSELQTNDLTSFLTVQRNSSEIDVTYKYNLINDYIKLEAGNGFCHSVSGVDYVFKTNVSLTRL